MVIVLIVSVVINLISLYILLENSMYKDLYENLISAYNETEFNGCGVVE